MLHKNNVLIHRTFTRKIKVCLIFERNICVQKFTLFVVAVVKRDFHTFVNETKHRILFLLIENLIFCVY